MTTYAKSFHHDLYLNQVRRIITKAGAERVSSDAVIKLCETLEYIGDIVMRQAVELANHRGGKILKPQDVKLAMKMKYKINFP